MSTLFVLTPLLVRFFFFFFFNDTATTEIYTLSLHDALPILNERPVSVAPGARVRDAVEVLDRELADLDRKSTRLNSSHGYISYAVFCLKKKKKTQEIQSSRSLRSAPAVRTSLATSIYTHYNV